MSVEIINAIKDCLSKYCPLDSINVLKRTCNTLKTHRHAGVYVFVDESSNTIYYVGETSNLADRVYKTHCRGLIGASEGVVRFLMYLFKELCSDEEVVKAENVIRREEIVRKRLAEFISSLSIYIGYCKEHKLESRKRLEVEKCLKEKLKPILQ